MAREINLDGGEMLVIKALGVRGGEISGEVLLEKIPSMDANALIDVLKSLMMMGYIDGDKSSFYSAEELKGIHFQVNSGYSRELKEALDPQPQSKSKRVRRE
jgi:hypothetical protein